MKRLESLPITRFAETSPQTPKEKEDNLSSQNFESLKSTNYTSSDMNDSASRNLETTTNIVSGSESFELNNKLRRISRPKTA